MTKIGVNFKIDVKKIDKARLFSGQKGTYLDATVFIDIDEFDQYGNSGMITQDVSKEEKAQNVKGNILGNCKVFWQENSNQQQGGFTQQQQQPSTKQLQQPQQQQAQQYPQQPQQQGGFQQQPQQQPNNGIQPVDFDDSIPF